MRHRLRQVDGPSIASIRDDVVIMRGDATNRRSILAECKRNLYCVWIKCLLYTEESGPGPDETRALKNE